MEKKKIIILIVIVVLIGIINLAHRGKAYDYYLQYFSVDKDLYYNDETIHINASWNLDYTPPAETSYIYIKIFNATETLWTSEFHSEVGENLTGNWDISIKDLNLASNLTSYFLSQLIFIIHVCADIIFTIKTVILQSCRNRYPDDRLCYF